ncbi:MAG: hypothetical protein AAF244_05475, partial [Pseudomonadota bacterium]
MKKILLFFIIFILTICFYFLTFDNTREAHGYQIDWSFSTERPMLGGWSTSMRPVIDKSENVYYCGGYGWNDDISLYKLDRNGNELWRIKTLETCNHMQFANNRLFVWIQNYDTVNVYDTNNGKKIKYFENFSRLAKTPRWIYSVFDNRPVRIDPQTLEYIVIPKTAKTFKAYKDKIFFPEKDKIFSIADNQDQPELEVELQKPYENWHIFVSDSFICLPIEHARKDKPALTQCYDRNTNDLYNLEGHNTPLNTNIINDQFIILKSTKEGENLLRATIFNIPSEQISQNIRSNYATFIDDGILLEKYKKLSVVTDSK